MELRAEVQVRSPRFLTADLCPVELKKAKDIQLDYRKFQKEAKDEYESYDHKSIRRARGF